MCLQRFGSLSRGVLGVSSKYDEENGYSASKNSREADMTAERVLKMIEERTGPEIGPRFVADIIACCAPSPLACGYVCRIITSATLAISAQRFPNRGRRAY